jgi:hypothetical protein
MSSERANHLAGEAVQGDTEFAAPVRPSDFRLVLRVRMLNGSHCSWSEGWVDIPSRFCLWSH